MDAALATRTRVGIIGMGRVGSALGRALAGSDAVQIGVLHARSEQARRDAAAATGADVVAELEAVLAGSDVVLLCVPDDAVEQVAHELARTATRPVTVVVTSGSVALSALRPLRDAGHAVARMHPLAPITPATRPADLVGVPAGIAGDRPASLAVARELATALGMDPLEVPEQARVAWHVAATMAANHAVALVAASRDVAAAGGIDGDRAGVVMARLAEQAVARAAVETPEQALTGPVSRGDRGTIAAHLALLAASAPDLLDGYRALARQTLELARSAGRLDAATADAIDALLAGSADHATEQGARSLAVVERVEELRDVLRTARARTARIGFVPTMGALHDGHAELIRRAREECDVVVVSCFVNPTQFGPGEDLDRYPRTPDADAAIVADAGGDVLWRPCVVDVYGDDPDAGTQVRVGSLGARLEGASRPGHFDGVATVVVRLLGAVQPHVLYLGEKDFQQLAVLRRVVADLLLPVELRAVETVRDADGLARSSRNAYLDPAQRRAARALPAALDAAEGLVAAGERDAALLRAAARRELDRVALVETDYVELADAETLEPLDHLDRPAVLLLAARVGSTRLIDNRRLAPRPHPPKEQP